MQARLDKEERRVALERFAEGKIRYLVTSDLGARGLDIAGLTHVVSLDLPEEPTVYIHRAGRTGRAGAKGVSIVLADAVELKRASHVATREGFVFRCKLLEGGEVLEPPVEDFFVRVERAEAEKAKHRAGRLHDGPARGPYTRSPNAPPSYPRNAPVAQSRDPRDRNPGGREGPRREAAERRSPVPRPPRKTAAPRTEGPKLSEDDRYFSAPEDGEGETEDS
jgi:superfamily II DNA/RNA helicase